ncbi:hypothetical protein CEUSTIGMA_g6108.t1 [Chlamydomonas eustigma]|uniref:Uncharacterized protein n=1 Tax=Chlamydomonas eustigma TaxID=1157962 RepID=A0A250X7D4_9CHLO|nr:hypothetical protein CEUSTIGMA_g6108.t1 [Chlamydomonas eustigma]|eukprot:GAX78670.1 hypothetical protein CEUSTIGMA_g6108.t1 [Chlamydomonas eustigma]
MRKDLGLLKEPVQVPKPKPPIATEDPFRPTPRHKRNALMPRTFMQRLATQAEEGSRDANNDFSLDASSGHLTISLDLSSPSGEHCPSIVSPVDAISKLYLSALHSLDEAQVWPQLSQIGAAGGRHHSGPHSSLSLDDHQMVMDYPDSIDGIASNPLWISSDNKEVAQQHAIGLPRDSSRSVTERGVVRPQREAAPLSTLPNAGVTQNSFGLNKFSPSSRWSSEKNPVQKPATALLASP